MPPVSSSPEKALNAILPLIASGNAYEAHQKARTFASRYVKASQYDTAIQVLFQSSRELLKSSHAGSGSDLANFMIDVYCTKEQPVDASSRGNVTQLIALTGSEGVWRKTIIDKAIGWTSDYGESPLGDPLLHQYIGELLYKEGSFEQAETHFLAAGNRDSARSYAVMMLAWLPADGAPAPFAIRGVLPYLSVQNILAARTFLSEFISQLSRLRPNLLTGSKTTTIPSVTSLTSTSPSQDELFVTTDQTLNFLQLVVRLCQRGNGETADQEREARNAWVRLAAAYRTKAPLLGTVSVQQALANIGNAYFNIPMPRTPGNPLQEIMATMFGGGPGSSGGASGRGRRGLGGPNRRIPAAGRGGVALAGGGGLD